ncbi:hypothetical protein OsI_20536 [Oryza sativa Indica Group]|uniref:Uncharacterized protein n=1 Tax=Oryza sativa subsp. indica TaxID=39946 RepID=B8AZR7_ORYSI|nr:hypothetical protein OsI_20536 [Oryza sativa Indica Group]
MPGRRRRRPCPGHRCRHLRLADGGVCDLDDDTVPRAWPPPPPETWQPTPSHAPGHRRTSDLAADAPSPAPGRRRRRPRLGRLRRRPCLAAAGARDLAADALPPASWPPMPPPEEALVVVESDGWVGEEERRMGRGWGN